MSVFALKVIFSFHIHGHNYVDVTVVDATGNCPIHFATEARNNVEFERIVSDLRGR